MDLDTEKTEKLEAEFNRLVERRAKELAKDEGHRTVEEELNRRERARQLKRREENRRGWIDFHGHQHRVFLDMAGHHADRRARLMAEAGYEPNEAPGPEAAPPSAEVLESIANKGGGGNA